MTMVLVSTVTVGVAGAASIDFTGIPQTGQDLMVVLSARGGDSANSSVKLYFNGSLAALAGKMLLGNTSIGSGGLSNTNSNIGYLNGSSSTASTFSSFSVYIPRYATTGAKSLSADAVTEQNGNDSFVNIVAISSEVTSAVISLQLIPVGTFAQYSTASLYTISTTGATGATVA